MATFLTALKGHNNCMDIQAHQAQTMPPPQCFFPALQKNMWCHLGATYLMRREDVRGITVCQLSSLHPNHRVKLASIINKIWWYTAPGWAEQCSLVRGLKNKATLSSRHKLFDWLTSRSHDISMNVRRIEPVVDCQRLALYLCRSGFVTNICLLPFSFFYFL